MEKNKNLSSNNELMDDSMDAVAGGNKEKGWTKQQKKDLRAYCQNFDNPDEKFQEFTTKYTHAEFQEKFRKAWGGFKF